MKKILTMILILCLIPTAYAKRHGQSKPSSKVMYRLSMEQWVSTQSATVTVSANLSLKSTALAKARKALLSKLNTIAKADWHITQFNRSKDNSGLERLSVQAQARLPESALDGLRDKTARISRPGESFQIQQINFMPSLAEMQAGKSALRDKIYEQVNAEITRLNSAYPPLKFKVKMINFIPGYMRARRQQAGAMKTFALAQAPMSVSNKLKLTAIVIVTADRKLTPPTP